ncbi:MAG: hypothetical protein AB4372_28115, partial [Xenococcus sp. (in: cyanobacteria)]
VNISFIDYLGLTQISPRYGKESSRDGFEYIAILIKKIGQLQRQSNFSNLLVNTYEGVWGRRHVPNGGSGGLVPQ